MSVSSPLLQYLPPNPLSSNLDPTFSYKKSLATSPRLSVRKGWRILRNVDSPANSSPRGPAFSRSLFERTPIPFKKLAIPVNSSKRRKADFSVFNGSFSTLAKYSSEPFIRPSRSFTLDSFGLSFDFSFSRSFIKDCLKAISSFIASERPDPSEPSSTIVFLKASPLKSICGIWFKTPIVRAVDGNVEIELFASPLTYSVAFLPYSLTFPPNVVFFAASPNLATSFPAFELLDPNFKRSSVNLLKKGTSLGRTLDATPAPTVSA